MGAVFIHLPSCVRRERQESCIGITLSLSELQVESERVEISGMMTTRNEYEIYGADEVICTAMQTCKGGRSEDLFLDQLEDLTLERRAR